MKKIILIIMIVIIVVTGGLIYMRYLRNGNNKKELLRTAVVEQGDIVIKIAESGQVESVTTVDVKSELAGEVKKLFVEEGDSVSPGNDLALIQQESSQAQQVAQARASVESAKLDLEEAEKNLERKKELYQEGFIAKKDVEDVEKLYKSSKIQYNLAEKQLWLVLGESESISAQNLALKKYDSVIIKSPISGKIINIYVEEGEIITSGTKALGDGGTTILTIADLNRLVIKADINEVDVNKIQVGQTVKIGFDAIRGNIYQGKIKKIALAGSVTQNIVVYPIEVEIQEPDEMIRLGMTADLDIILEKAENVLCVPKEVVRKRDGRDVVEIIKDGKRIPQPVITGLEDDVKIEIKKGLEEGDRVVIPQFDYQMMERSEDLERRRPLPPPG
jgi:HlyD family secretion protein